MSVTNTDHQAAELLPPGRFDSQAVECIEAAEGLARATGFTRIQTSHLALALLRKDGGRLDALLRKRFAGLQSATIAESLLTMLEVNAGADAGEGEASPAQGPPEARHYSAGAWEALRRAEDLAARLGVERVNLQALAGALFERPEGFIAEAFRDAGVSASGLAELADHLAEAAARPAQAAAPLTLFFNSALSFDKFGPVSRAALGMLASLAASQPERNLRDTDLLYCLLEQEDSLLAEALHVMGVPVASVRRYLQTTVGSFTAVRGSCDLPEERLGRLLRRVFREAAALAGRENCPAVSESHLIRAHLDRVAGAADNIYQRLGIATPKLRGYLAQYSADRDRPEAQKQATWVEDIEGYLLSQVINQERAVRRVAPALRRMRSGLAEPGRLMGVFLFLGPTGVGKTELARAIGDIAFEPKPGVREPYLIKIDCGRLARREDIVQLLGAAQGLVGYKEGRLTNGLRDKPRAVILFDEAEKAHRDIWQSLLTFFDEGVVHEADGTEYDATGCILAATSNLGYSCFGNTSCNSAATGGRCRSVKSGADSLEDFIWSCVREYFSPEFLGRFGRENVIFFNHFDKPSYEAIIRLQAGRLVEEMEGRGFKVNVPAPVIEFLTELAWERREEGARPVRRLITEHLRDRMVAAITDDPNRRNFSFVALAGSGEVVLEQEKSEGEQDDAPPAAQPADDQSPDDEPAAAVAHKRGEAAVIYDDIIGSLVGERYRVRQLLGAGAFGQVFQAQHEIFGIPLRTVALKLFTKGYATRDNAAEVFKEALWLEALTADARTQGKETHLVAIYDIGILREYHHIPYVAMEYVDGGSLADRLAQAGRFPLGTTLRYVRDICAGLVLAHKAAPAIIHRDLKPPNVLITKNGFVKVADFGVAIDRYQAFLRGGGGGTISYSPPESREAVPSSPAHDVYSLGVMMLELLLGKNPLEEVMRRAQEADRPVEPELERAQEMMAELMDPATGRPFEDSLPELREVRGGDETLSRGLFKEVLARCLALNPAARFSGAQALDAALAECQEERGRDIEENVESGSEKVKRLLRQARRNLARGGQADLDKARQQFEEVRGLVPRNPQVCFGLAEVYEKRGQLADAVREQKTGTDLSRTRDSLNRLADLYERMGETGEAKRARLIAETLAS